MGQPDRYCAGGGVGEELMGPQDQKQVQLY